VTSSTAIRVKGKPWPTSKGGAAALDQTLLISKHSGEAYGPLIFGQSKAHEHPHLSGGGIAEKKGGGESQFQTGHRAVKNEMKKKKFMDREGSKGSVLTPEIKEGAVVGGKSLLCLREREFGSIPSTRGEEKGGSWSP